jgi:ribonuclease VapC
VLDSSAVLAVVMQEPGADLVTEALTDAAVSTVNVAESYGIASRNGLPMRLMQAFFRYQGIEIIPLSVDDAEVAGRMQTLTASAGLSLGDRCCLALGLSRRAEILTADRAWLQFADPLGLQIRLIR